MLETGSPPDDEKEEVRCMSVPFVAAVRIAVGAQPISASAARRVEALLAVLMSWQCWQISTHASANKYYLQQLCYL